MKILIIAMMLAAVSGGDALADPGEAPGACRRCTREPGICGCAQVCPTCWGASSCSAYWANGECVCNMFTICSGDGSPVPPDLGGELTDGDLDAASAVLELPFVRSIADARMFVFVQLVAAIPGLRDHACDRVRTAVLEYEARAG